MAKSTKRNGFQLSALAAAMFLTVTTAQAAGLGRITVLSPLGQPLRAEIDVNASSDELASMNARLASPEAFRQVGIEYVPSIAGIRFVVEKRKDGQPYLKMFSDRPVNDPFLDVLVELTWSSGRMVREYTVLLDPPESLAPQAAPTSVAVPAIVAPAPVRATPAPAVATKPMVPASPPQAAAPVKQEAPVAAMSAPEAPAPAAAAKPAEESMSRLVKRGDTLTKIATAAKPDGISLDQMLAALFQSNREAFDGDNMNRLRAGKILNIPTAESVAAVSPSEARQVIVAHARDFNAYRSKLAASVAATPAKESEAQQTDQGKIAPKVADKAAPQESAKDKLEVSRSETAKETKALQGRISSLEEDLVARDRALNEANSRVAELEKNLADLKKLAELKSQAGAQMQKEAEAAKAPAEPPPPPAPPVVEPPMPAPAEPAPVEPPKTEAAAPAEPAAEAPKPVEKPAVEPPVSLPADEPMAEEPSFIDENPLLVYGGAGILVLLLAYLGLSRRRKAQMEEAVPTASRLSEGDLMANSVFGTTGGQSVDTSASIQTDFSQASLSAIDTDEGVDPVAEADVYMAYGRDAQAEEILLDALKSDPSRLAIYLKLLEIYSGHNNASKFEKVARDLHAQTGGTGPDWEKAAAMGRTLDPGNAFYAGDGQGAMTDEPVMPEVDVSMPEPVLEEPKAQGAATVTLPGQLSQMAKAAEPELTPSSLGFDLDLGAASPLESGSASADQGLDLDIGSAGDVQQADALDVDLSLPDAGGSETLEKGVAQENSSGLDFEFDLDSPAATPAPEIKETPIDFSGINLDLVTTPPAAVDETGVEFGSEGEESDVSTKLELAQAYEEMGDKEGARELLEEVIQEGSAQQQEAARAKLAALDA